MSDDKLKDYREIMEKRYALHKAQKDKEEQEKLDKENKLKMEEEEKLRLENESKLLKDLQYREEFDDFLGEMENVTLEMHNAISIIEIDMTLISFMSLLESNSHFIVNESLNQEIVGKVIQVVNSISQNENSKFDVTVKDENYGAAQRIAENIKIILKLINYENAGVDVELMDTTEDEKIAKDMHKREEQHRLQMNPSTHPDFAGFGHSLMDSGLSTIPNKTQNKIFKYMNNKLKDKINDIKPGIKPAIYVDTSYVDTSNTSDVKNINNIKNAPDDIEFIDDGYVDIPDEINPGFADDFVIPDEINPGFADDDFVDIPDDDFVDIPDDDFINIPNGTNKIENDKSNLGYHPDFDIIDDYDLLQMLHYQNELLDTNK